MRLSCHKHITTKVSRVVVVNIFELAGLVECVHHCRIANNVDYSIPLHQTSCSRRLDADVPDTDDNGHTERERAVHGLSGDNYGLVPIGRRRCTHFDASWLDSQLRSCVHGMVGYPFGCLYNDCIRPGKYWKRPPYSTLTWRRDVPPDSAKTVPATKFFPYRCGPQRNTRAKRILLQLV